MTKRMPDERFKVLRIFIEERKGFYIGTRDEAGEAMANEAARARENETRLQDVLLLVHELMSAPPAAREEAFARLKEGIHQLEGK